MPSGKHSEEKAPPYSAEELEVIKQLEKARASYHPQKDWTPFQIEQLKKYYGHVALSVLSGILHHSNSSIYSKASELGLTNR